ALPIWVGSARAHLFRKSPGLMPFLPSAFQCIKGFFRLGARRMWRGLWTWRSTRSRSSGDDTMSYLRSQLGIALLLIGVGLVFQAEALAATPTLAAAPSVAAGPICNGKYKDGLKPSPAELAEILKQHATWIRDSGSGNPRMSND